MATLIWPQEQRKSKQLPRALWVEELSHWWLMVTTSSGEQGTTAPRGRDVCVGWGSTENTLHGYCGEVKPEESNSQAEGATQSQCAHHFWNACPPALRHWYLSGQNHTSLLCSLPCPTVHTEGARRKLSKFYPPGLSLSPHTIMTEL